MKGRCSASFLCEPEADAHLAQDEDSRRGGRKAGRSRFGGQKNCPPKKTSSRSLQAASPAANSASVSRAASSAARIAIRSRPTPMNTASVSRSPKSSACQRPSCLCCDELYSSPDELYSSPRRPFWIPNFEEAVLGCIEPDSSDQISVGKP